MEPRFMHGGVVNIADRMKTDWNRRARSHARFWVATGHHADETTFAQSGLRDAEALYSMVAAVCDPSWRVLEIGCGVGRLLKALAPRFSYLHGVDVSGEMIRRSRHYLAGIANVATTETNGTDLRPFTPSSFNLIYSYVAFQHMPEEVFSRYLDEANRLLMPNGYLLFQIYVGTPNRVTPLDTFTLRVYDREALHRRLEAAGYQLEQRRLLGSDGQGFDSWIYLTQKVRSLDCPLRETGMSPPAGGHYVSPSEMTMYAALIAQLLRGPNPLAASSLLEELINTLDAMLADGSGDGDARRYREVLGKLQTELAIAGRSRGVAGPRRAS